MTVYAGIYEDHFQSKSGRRVPDAEITFYEIGTTTLAVLYTDRDRTDMVANPLPTGVANGAPGLDVRANAVVWLDPGRYWLHVEVNDVLVFEGPVTVDLDPDEPGAGAGVLSIEEGTGISVDATDPQHPVVSATGSGSGVQSVSVTAPITLAGSADDPVIGINQGALTLSGGQITSGTVAAARIDAAIARVTYVDQEVAGAVALANQVGSDLIDHENLTTSAHGGIVASTDPRLSDARTPTAHAASHAQAGSDPVALAASQVTDLASVVKAYRLDEFAAPAGPLGVGSQRLTGVADGVALTDAATLGQLSGLVNGQKWKNVPADAMTTGVLPTVTATTTTLTGSVNGALPAQDGVTLVAGDTLLVKDQAAGAQDGIYDVTAVGSGGAPFVLTRRADADTAVELTDATILVDAGTTGRGDIYTFPTITTLGTTDATPAKTGEGNTVYAADGTSIVLTGQTFSRGAVTGDIGIPAGSGTATLPVVNGNVGTFGDAANVAAVTVNAKGQVTAAGNVPIVVAQSAVTGLVAALAAKADDAATTSALAGKQPIDADLTALAAAGNSTVLAATTASFLLADEAKLDALPTAAALTASLAAKADASSLGTAAAVNTGTISGTIPLLSTGGRLPIARIASGTPDGTKFVRDDGTLVTPGGFTPILVRKSADETVNNTITLQNDDELLFAIGASEVWQFEIEIVAGGATAADLAVAINGPAGATVRATVAGLLPAASTLPATIQHHGVITALATGIFGSGTNTGTRGFCRIAGTIVNSTTPGTVNLQWAQSVLDASNLTVALGSYLLARRIS